MNPLKDYLLINYEDAYHPNLTDIMNTLDRDVHFRYNAFMELMKKLESVATEDRGLWFNRSTILRKIKYLTIVIDKNTKEVAAFYVIRLRKFDHAYVIDFMQVFSPCKGLGGALLRNHPKFSTLRVEEAMSGSVGFWDKLNIPYEHVSRAGVV